jgi:hypothetical protein
MKLFSQLPIALVLICTIALSTYAGEIPNDYTSTGDMGQPVAATGNIRNEVTSPGNIPNDVTSTGIMQQPVVSTGDISCGVTAIMLAFTSGLW